MGYSSTVELHDDDNQRTDMVPMDDPDFEEHYIDNHIENVISDFDMQMMDRIWMTVNYEDGKELKIPLGNVPVVRRAYINGEWRVLTWTMTPQAHHYVRRNGLIYPVDVNDNVLFNYGNTPILGRG